MTEEYKTKLFKSISKLPPLLQSEYNSALKKHNFNLEIYVPQNNLNKKSKTNRNYLRNKLIDFDDNYLEEKEVLKAMKKETKHFSNQYQDIIKDGENTNGTNRLIQVYGKSIEEYKEKGYDESKLFPKRNIFEASILLEDVKRFEMILESGEEKVLNKEINFVKRFHNEILKLNKGIINKEQRSHHLKKQHMSQHSLPPIQSSFKLMEIDNLKLHSDILQTERTFIDMSFRNELSSLYHSKKVNDSIETMSKIKDNSNSDQSLHQEGIFISSKGMRILMKPQNQKGTQSPTKLSLTKKPRPQRMSPPKLKKKMKEDINQQQRELTQLYERLQKGNYEKEVSNVKSYLTKYKKKKIEPLK